MFDYLHTLPIKKQIRRCRSVVMVGLLAVIGTGSGVSEARDLYEPPEYVGVTPDELILVQKQAYEEAGYSTISEAQGDSEATLEMEFARTVASRRMAEIQILTVSWKTQGSQRVCSPCVVSESGAFVGVLPYGEETRDFFPKLYKALDIARSKLDAKLSRFRNPDQKFSW